MRELRPRDPHAIAEVEGVIDRIRAEWLAEPNVVAIGPGIKLVGGRPRVDTLCIRFFVNEKVSAEEVGQRGWREIPSEIEGIPIDVSRVAQRPLQLLDTRTRRFDPLIGGIAIGNLNRQSVGTLGAIVFHNDDGRAVGLTNEHVLVFTNQGSSGDPVHQPRSGSGDVIEIVEADCCPGGQLQARDIPNPVRDTAFAIAVGAAVVAALADEADPHRRGQESTPVEDGERTLLERVSVSTRYPEIPLPGTPYSVDVDWTYERHTDRRILTHRVAEKRRNAHVLREQWLLTDRPSYTPGQLVHYLAAVVHPDRQRRCPPLHVVAHSVPSSGTRALRTILRPVTDEVRRELTRLFPEPRIARKCVSFRRLQVGSRFRQVVLDRFRFRSRGEGFLRVVDLVPAPSGDKLGELSFPQQGVEILFPFPAQQGVAELVCAEGESLTLRAFDGNTQVDVASSAGLGTPPFTLQVEASRITSVVVEGDGVRGVLVRLCAGRRVGDDACLYWGRRRLSPLEETGSWRNYLVVQTVNDVSPGTEPLEAAKTIGGLATSNNLTAGGRVQVPGYPEGCAIDAVSDSDFTVGP